MDVAAWAVTWPGRARPNRGPVMSRPAARERREMAKWTVLGRARASRVRPGFAIHECVADGKLDFGGPVSRAGPRLPSGRAHHVARSAVREWIVLDCVVAGPGGSRTGTRCPRARRPWSCRWRDAQARVHGY